MPRLIPKFPRLTWLAGVTFLLCTLLYAALGYKRFFASDLTPIDYRLRWVEQQYFYQGTNPNDVSLHALNHEDPEISLQARKALDERLGPPPTLGYPPWAHLIQIPLIPRGTSYHTSRIVFAAANLAALALSAVLLWSAATRCGLTPRESFFTVASCLSLASITTTLGNGQYGIIVNAMILLAIHQLDRRRHFGAAVALSLALLKPTSSGPFFFLLSRKSRLLAAITCTSIIGLFSLAFWIVTEVHPLRALLQMVTYTTPSMGAAAPWNQTLLSWSIALGTPVLPATLAFGLGGLALSLIVGFHYQAKPWFVQAAAFGVIGRLWTKHFAYDNVLIMFLLFGLAVMFFKYRSFGNLAWFSAVGLSLWLPTSLFNNPITALTQLTIWGAATVFLARKTPDQSAS
jgi:hypothetical protein